MFAIGVVTVYMICKKEKLLQKQSEVMKIIRDREEAAAASQMEKSDLLSPKTKIDSFKENQQSTSKIITETK